MAYYFHKIDGSEHPELFLLWLLEYQRNVLKADNITLTGKVDCLLQLMQGMARQGKAKSKVARSIESLDIWTALTAPEHAPMTVGNCFTNITIKKKVTSFTPSDLTTYLAAPVDDSTVDTLTINRIEEALHVLKICVFGCNHAVQNALFIIGATADASDSETSIDASTAKRLLKKFRKKKKQFTKSKKAYWQPTTPTWLISDICVETVDSTD